VSFTASAGAKASDAARQRPLSRSQAQPPDSRETQTVPALLQHRTLLSASHSHRRGSSGGSQALLSKTVAQFSHRRRAAGRAPVTQVGVCTYVPLCHLETPQWLSIILSIICLCIRIFWRTTDAWEENQDEEWQSLRIPTNSDT